jgi:hypothetical protein
MYSICLSQLAIWFQLAGIGDASPLTSSHFTSCSIAVGQNVLWRIFRLCPFLCHQRWQRLCHWMRHGRLGRGLHHRRARTARPRLLQGNAKECGYLAERCPTQSGVSAKLSWTHSLRNSVGCRGVPDDQTRRQVSDDSSRGGIGSLRDDASRPYLRPTISEHPPSFVPRERQRAWTDLD